jgi:protoporphyrinogen/coproporphyrinogen III oxidase
MIGGARMQKIKTEYEYIFIALNALKNHLKIDTPPDAIHFNLANRAIPQYQLNYTTQLQKINHEVAELSKNFKCLGSAFNGVSINDCIAQAEKFARVF